MDWKVEGAFDRPKGITRNLVAIGGWKYDFVYVSVGDPNLVISRSKVQLGEYGGYSQIIQELFNSGNGELIPHHDYN